MFTRRRWGVLALGAALVACTPPKPSPDAGCQDVVPVGFATSWTVEGAPFELTVVSPIGDCGVPEASRTAAAEVRSAAGATVAAQVTSLTASNGYTVAQLAVPALPVGRYEWRVTFEPGLGVQSGGFHVVENRLDAGVVDEVYVDNMETCWPSPARTTAGATLCPRSSDIWVYRDGGIEGSFTGVDLVVLGDGLWSSEGDQLQFRTDTGSALRVDGSATVAFGSSGDLGESGPARAARSTSKGAVEASFDGGVLVARVLDLDWTSPPPGIRLVQGDELWLADLGVQSGPCLVERGCQQTTCAPTVACYAQATSTNLLAVDEAGLLRLETRAGVDHIELAFYPRPFALAAQAAARGVAPSGTLLSSNAPPPSWQVVSGAAAWVQADGTVLVAHPNGQDFVLERYDLHGAEPLWATRDWVVGKLGPRKLRFVSRH